MTNSLHKTPSPGLIYVQNTVQTFKNKNLSLPPPIDQSVPAMDTAISPKSISDLNTIKVKLLMNHLGK